MKNFGNIKNAVNTVFVESLLKESKNNQKTIKKSIRDIKKNDVLRKQYLIYSNLEEAYLEDRTAAFELIKENLSVLEDVHPQSIINENMKFTKTLNENAGEQLKESIEYEDEDMRKLHENISKLLLTKKRTDNLNERTKLMSEIADYIQKPKKNTLTETKTSAKDQNVPTDIMVKFATDRFNRKYRNLSETEKKVVKTALNNDDDEKRNLFESTKKECLENINKLLNENHDNDIQTENKLLKAKEKLLEMEYDPDRFPTHMNKLLTLKD